MEGSKYFGTYYKLWNHQGIILELIFVTEIAPNGPKWRKRVLFWQKRPEKSPTTEKNVEKKTTEVSFHWLKLFPPSQECEDWLLDNGQVPADAFKKLVGD